MQPAVLIRLRPTGPWRFGPGDGGFNRIDATFGSDRLYSALTLAMVRLGWSEEWLEWTARSAAPAISFTSLFPYQGETLFVPPPRTLWPPPSTSIVAPNPVFAAKMRWAAARFVPTNVIESMLLAQPVVADQWLPDPESGCLLRRDRPNSSPFRVQLRNGVAVDRLGNASVRVTSHACAEFEAGAGLWCLLRYNEPATEQFWSTRIEAAFRLLADSGFGARKTSGWGQAAEPEIQRGQWPHLLLPKLARVSGPGNALGNGDSSTPFYWFLSLYIPNSADSIDWRNGDYRLAERAGYIENSAGSGARKKTVRMIAEGSVLASAQEPIGQAVNVAPDGFVHPVYRSGFALALRLPELGQPELSEPIEMPSTEEALEPGPCLDEGATPHQGIEHEIVPLITESETGSPEQTFSGENIQEAAPEAETVSAEAEIVMPIASGSEQDSATAPPASPEESIPNDPEPPAISTDPSDHEL